MRGALAALVVAISLGAGSAHAEPAEEAVLRTFEDYRNALQDRQGDIAGFLVTAETLAFYDSGAKAALSAGPDALAEMPLVQQLLALRLRQAVPADRLKTMSAEEVIGLSVDQGLVNSQGLRGLRLGEVQIQGDVALAPQIDPWGRDIGVTWRFRKTQGNWRVDLRPTLMAANAMLVTMQRERGIPTRDFLLGLVQASTGQRADDSLFVPPMSGEERLNETAPPRNQ